MDFLRENWEWLIPVTLIGIVTLLDIFVRWLGKEIPIQIYLGLFVLALCGLAWTISSRNALITLPPLEQLRLSLKQGYGIRGHPFFEKKVDKLLDRLLHDILTKHYETDDANRSKEELMWALEALPCSASGSVEAIDFGTDWQDKFKDYHDLNIKKSDKKIDNICGADLKRVFIVTEEFKAGKMCPGLLQEMNDQYLHGIKVSLLTEDSIRQLVELDRQYIKEGRGMALFHYGSSVSLLIHDQEGSKYTERSMVTSDDLEIKRYSDYFTRVERAAKKLDEKHFKNDKPPFECRVASQ